MNPPSALTRSAKRVVMFVLAIGLVVVAWELYRNLGPDKGGKVFGWTVLPKANARVMPSVGDILGRFGDPLGRGGEAMWWFLTKSAWYTLQLAFLGFLVGSLLGVGLAVVMARLRMFERALMPYLVISQTVPLIALAPLIAGWGGKLSIFGWEWQRWTSVVTMGVFLSFFPVALGTLRGLKSAPAASVELMDSLAAPWRRRASTDGLLATALAGRQRGGGGAVGLSRHDDRLAEVLHFADRLAGQNRENLPGKEAAGMRPRRLLHRGDGERQRNVR